MFTSAPFPPPPLLPSFPTFAATLAPFPSPLFLPLLHPRPFPPPPFADQNQLSPSFLLELFSPPPLLLFFAVSHCFVFFHHSYQIKRIPPTPIRIFIPNFCAYALACAHLFLRAAFIQVNFSSSRVNRSAFRRTRMRCF